MPDPISTATTTYFSVAKIVSIIAGVCGSIIPILALADKAKISLLNAFFMALTGSSFSIFVGPWLAQKLDINSMEGIVALSWVMGATGVFLVRVVFKWLETRGVGALDTVFVKVVGKAPPVETETELNLNPKNDSE